MRLRLFVGTTIAVSCSLAAIDGSLRAQSLADAARAEQARRKQITRPARVYTNKDLVSVPEPAAPPPAPAPDSATGGSTAQAPVANEGTTDAALPAVSSNAAAEATKDQARDQAYWSGRLKDLATQLDRDRVLADALQSRINALTADFSARDDPVQRSLIGVDRQKALDELDRMRRSIATDQKAIADFQEEARRADVPPGWLR
jgi:hypothetical protein